ALVLLREYDFPGNLRELKNAMEHAVIMASGEAIGAEHLPRTMAKAREPQRVPKPAAHSARPLALKEQREAWLAPLQQPHLSDRVGETDGNVRDAARLAEVDAVTMYRLLERRGVYVPKARRRRTAPK